MQRSIKFNFMKKLFLLSSVLFILVMSSCREIANSVLDVLPPFEVPFTTQIEVPFATVSTTSYTRAPEIQMDINLNNEIKAQNPKFSIINLKSVKMNKLTVNYVSSSLGNKLDVIKNARIYIKGSNLEDRLIASAENNTDPNQIVFLATDAEIAEYFRSDKNSLIIEIQGSRISTDKIKMNLTAGFKVRVEL